MSELRDAALSYARRGWAVFPLMDRGKDPRVQGAYKAATTDLAQVETWWARWPQANIGLATGAVSGLWVLDIDGPQGEQSFEQLVGEHGGELVETLMATTGKGYHLYWRLPAGLEQGRRIGVRPGLDVIGGSGYLVAPPSIHPSGRQYGWCDADREPQLAPDWLLAVEKPKPVSSRTTLPIAGKAPRMPVEGAAGHDGIRDGKRYLEGVLRRAVIQVAHSAQGNRNHELFRQVVWAASVAAGVGFGMADVEASLRHAARMAGLEDREIELTLKSGLAAGARNPMRGGRS